MPQACPLTDPCRAFMSTGGSSAFERYALCIGFERTAMRETNLKRQINKQPWVLRLIGGGLLGLGLISAFLGPLEMFCFYLFSEGGMFHYEGFGFGSFMFGNISAQILGYFFIAAIAIPIGYGTMRQRRWARHLTLGFFQCWYTVGFPLMIAFIAVLVSSKDVSSHGNRYHK